MDVSPWLHDAVTFGLSRIPIANAEAHHVSHFLLPACMKHSGSFSTMVPSTLHNGASLRVSLTTMGTEEQTYTRPCTRGLSLVTITNTALVRNSRMTATSS